MLKGIPSILSPALLKVLMEMGHGDEIILADGNFPVESVGKNTVVVRADGHGVPELLRAILRYLPLDAYAPAQAVMMQVSLGDPVVPVIQDEYRAQIASADPSAKIELVDRFDFYGRAKQAYAIVATGETAIYANILLKKGVVQES